MSGKQGWFSGLRVSACGSDLGRVEAVVVSGFEGVREERATGSRKRDRRLKEKTVVPVVVGGKVGNVAKCLFGEGLGLCGVF